MHLLRLWFWKIKTRPTVRLEELAFLNNDF
jgi:hypothetical protein